MRISDNASNWIAAVLAVVIVIGGLVGALFVIAHAVVVAPVATTGAVIVVALVALVYAVKQTM